ncbi:MAG: ribbon-helix-helix domain-containing protein [Geminicoccaceae bacterium]|nr:ribbon-helix-helix domain-containing protein [Geminicoccaceae bacterium]
MIRKTMRIGDVRTSIKLEGEFWSYLKHVADGRDMRLSGLVNEVAAATPDRTNLASTLRTFALVHARLRSETLQREMDKLSLTGNTQDLVRVMEACPLPCLVLDGDRQVRQMNRAFAFWLNVDVKATLGARLDNIMILRGPGMKDMWTNLLDGRTARAGFNATYVSPGKVRTAQAIAVALSATPADPNRRGCVVLFETLSGHT